LIAGTKVKRGVVRYPDLGRVCHFADGCWRVVDKEGNLLREGVE